jgi:hypothetical protein
LNIATVVDHLLLQPKARREAHKRLAQVTANMRSLGVIDEHGRQVAGEMIGALHGIDGLFVYYVVMNHQLEYEEMRTMVEYLVDHSAVQRVLDRKDYEKRKEWIRERLRERRKDNPQVSWEDVEEEYDREFPRELARVEIIHSEFASQLPHPELHGGKEVKTIWGLIEDDSVPFLEFVAQHNLAHEEGSLFSYLARVMKVADTIAQATGIEPYALLHDRVRQYLATIDDRLLKTP